MTYSGATSVQFSIFTMDDALQADEVFKMAFRSLPGNTQTNRVPNPQQNYLSLASLNDERYLKTVRVSPGRLDLTITLSETIMSPSSIPVFEAIPALNVLEEAISNCNFDTKEFLRVAINVGINEPKDNLDDARNDFYLLTEIPKISDDAEEMIFQVNRKKTVLNKFSINRLVQYLTASFHFAQMNFFNNMPQQLPMVGVSKFASVIQIDFNTVPGVVLIKSPELNAIFKELSSEVEHAILNPKLRELYRA